MRTLGEFPPATVYFTYRITNSFIRHVIAAGDYVSRLFPSILYTMLQGFD
jgi:hypothetical protein